MKINPSLLAAALVLGGLAVSRAERAEPFKFRELLKTMGVDDARQIEIAKRAVPTPNAVEMDQDRYIKTDGITAYEEPKDGAKQSVVLRSGEPVKLIAATKEGWQLVEVNRTQYDENNKLVKIRAWIKLGGATANVAENAQYADTFKFVETQKAGECRERFKAQLKTYIGTPYVWGGTGPARAGVDCSGLVVAALLEARCTRQAPPRVARDQKMAAGTITDPAKLQVGDLIFTGNPAHHVKIYLGEENGQKMMIQAQQTGTNVKSEPFVPGGAGTTYGDLLSALGATQ